MDGVAQHQLAARKQLEVFERGVVFLPVLERDDVTRRYGAMSLLPCEDVDPDPVSRRISGVGDFALQVAVFADPCCTDGFPGLRLLARFELRLSHPPRSPSRPT